MALEETRTLYEILVRFDEFGKPKGAHAQYLDGIARDGVLISAQPGPAIPLALVDTSDALTLKDVLGDAFVGIVAAKDEAEAQVAALEAEGAAKDANIQQLMADLEAARAALAEATAPPAEAE